MAKIRKFRPEPYSRGPHARAVHDAGGKLLELPVNRAKFNARLKAYAPGCGSPTPVVGTGSSVPCGVDVDDVRVFCLHCAPGSVAEALVGRLLEADEIVRVCAACEREVGPVSVEPHQRKSHGLCYRHAMAEYGSLFSPDEATSMDWAPDLAQASS